MSKVTTALLKKIFPSTPESKLSRFVTPFNTILPRYDITTKKRFAAFIANVAIESDRLKTTREYGPESYFNRYNGRKDLGNVREGDGPRYRGRDVLQTTGRFNYWRVVVAYLKVLTGKNWDNKQAYSNFDAYLKSDAYNALLAEADKYGVNFLANPELLEQFPHAVEAGCVFVQDNNLNAYADKGAFKSYAGVLNTGSPTRTANHYSERKAYYDLAMKVIPDDFELDAGFLPKKFVEPNPTPAPVEENPPAGQETINEPVSVPVVEVEQIEPAKDPPPAEGSSVLDSIQNKATAFSNRWIALPSTITAGLLGFWAWITSSPVNVIITLFSVAAAIAVVYIIVNSVRNAGKEKRDLKKFELETQLKLEREKRAHELQLATLEAAANKDKNTVRIVPMPIVTSDPESPTVG